MEDRKKINPSLPSDYVTLAQLKERWLQEKERKRREKEEEEGREERRRVEEEERKRKKKLEEEEEEEEREERRRREQKGRREEKRKNQRPKHGGDGESNETRTRNGRSQRTNRKMRREVRGNVDEMLQKPKQIEAAAAAVVEVARIGGNKERKNKGKERKSKIIRLEEGQLIPENEPEESMPMVLIENKDETRAVGKQSNQKCETSAQANQKMWKEKTLPVNGVVEIGRKLENLSIEVRGMMNSNGDRRVYRNYGRSKPRDCSLVWVKKEESGSGGSVAVGQSSTVLPQRRRFN